MHNNISSRFTYIFSILLFAFSFILLQPIIEPHSSAHAAVKICQYCKKPVQTAQFLEVEGKYYCSNHFRCANCDKSIGDQGYYKENRKYYDHACYLKLFAVTCAYCNQPIDGTYMTFDGKNYHDSCYSNHVALRCDLCGEIITGNYVSDYWGNNYHAEHQGKDPECAYCQRFISSASNGGQKYNDDRWICGLCAKTAITTLSQMNQLVTEVRQMLVTKGIEVPFEEADNHLVSRKELADVTKRSEPDVQGYAAFKESRIIFGLVPANQQADVYMLYGVPRVKAIQVLAHELMHLWQFRYAKRDADLALQEGSANYIAWLVMQDFSGDEVNFMLHNLEKDPDPVYGNGFRRIRKFAQAQNMETFLQYLRKNKTIPSGY